MKKIMMMMLVGVFAVGCAEKENELGKGKKFLMEGDYYGAYENFSKVIAKDPENCEANYGLLLADTLMLVDQINAIIGLAQGLGSTLSSSAGGIVDQIVWSFLSSFLEVFDEMDASVEVVEKKNCSFKIDYIIIQIGLSEEPLALFALKGQWDKPEAQLIGTLANVAKSLLKFILSIDLDLELDPVLEIVQDPNSPIMKVISSCDFSNFPGFLTSCDLTGLMRELGFAMDITGTFLSWHPERGYLFPEVSQEISEGLRRAGEAIEGIFKEVYPDEKKDNVLYIFDNDGDNQFTDISKDDIIINAYKVVPGSVTEPAKVTDEKCLYIGGTCVDVFLGLALSGIDANFIKNTVDILKKWSEGFDVQRIEKEGNPPQPLHIVELLDLLPPIISSPIKDMVPDVVRILPWNLFSSSVTEKVSGPKDWLPYWVDLDGDGVSEFLIEAEWAQDASIPSELTSYTFAGDASHFNNPFTFKGNTISVTIPPDCVFIESGGSGIITYHAHQDPSFHGFLEVNIYNLNQIKPEYAQCSTNACENKIGENWYPPSNDPPQDPCGLYALNKIMAGFMSQIMGIIDVISGILPQ